MPDAKPETAAPRRTGICPIHGEMGWLRQRVCHCGRDLMDAKSCHCPAKAGEDCPLSAAECTARIQTKPETAAVIARLRKIALDPGECPACSGTGLNLTCTCCQGTGFQSERQIVINEGANALILGSIPW